MEVMGMIHLTILFELGTASSILRSSMIRRSTCCDAIDLFICASFGSTLCERGLIMGQTVGFVRL
jgi:hypothetical protein